MPVRLLEPEPPYDLEETTRFLRTGGRDPTIRREPGGIWRAAQYPSGPATLHVTDAGDHLRCEAFGPGADEALHRAPRLLGLHEAPWELPPHPRTDALLEKHPGVRLNDTGDVFEALAVTILQQLVTWAEAAASWRQLVELCGEPVPGCPQGLLAPPTAKQVRAAGVIRVMGCGVSRKRAEALLRAASRAGRLQDAADMDTAAARHRLERIQGIGPWTSTSVLGHRLGRPEPLIEGDYWLPHTVAWALEGRPRGTEEDLPRILAPFEGQAFRVIRLIMAASIQPPKRGPRHAIGWRER